MKGYRPNLPDVGAVLPTALVWIDGFDLGYVLRHERKKQTMVHIFFR